MNMATMSTSCLRAAPLGLGARAKGLGSRAAVAPIAPLRAKATRVTLRSRKPVMVKAATDDLNLLQQLDYNTKEDFRSRRRNVFGADDWKRHRSTGRYLRHISTMFTSSVIKGLLPPVVFFAAVGAAVAYINTETDYSIMLPMAPFNTTASALSLLLVFRTNASYGRWWEARKIWGGLLNRSRDFVRQSLTWFNPEDQALKEQLVRYMIAFAIALKVHLRPSEENMRAELEGTLNPDELELALSKVHVPNHLLRMMSQIIYEANMDPILTTQMDANITEFEDDLGKCERIFKTPIPLAYTRMTSRFLLLWLALLPLALWKDLGWVVVPAEAMIAFLLLGIEEIGVAIEEPFSIISCEGIVGSVTDNCKAMLETCKSDETVVAPKAR